MDKKIAALSLIAVIVTGFLYSQPAYAHNFSGNESSDFLGKVANLKAELNALQMDISDPTAVSWHVDKIGEYWNANDTKEMGERNQLLAKEIPDSLNTVISDAQKANPDAATIKQDVSTLDGYLDEGITARIDKTALQNSTIQALAVTDLITETLESYGDAINSSVDMNDMSQLQGMNSMNMGSSQTSSGGMSSSGQTVMMSKGAGAGQDCVTAKNCFDPQTLTVSPGTTVTWKNMDTVSHTVTSGNPSDNQTGTLFDSSLVKPGDTFSFTFKDAGTYNYFCMVHPWMTGTVVVGQGGGSGMNMGTSYSQNEAPPIHLVQMSGMDSSSSTSSTPQTVVNTAAYHSAQAHATEVKNYFDTNVVPIAPSGVSSFVTKADDNMAKLIDAINNKADPQTIMQIVHMNIHPALISAFNLPQMHMESGNAAVPEFPMPILLVVISIIGVVAITRFRTKLH